MAVQPIPIPKQFYDRKEALKNKYTRSRRNKKGCFFIHTALIVSSGIVTAVMTAVSATSVGVSDARNLLILQLVTASLGVIATITSIVAGGVQVCSLFYRGRVKNMNTDFGELQDAVNMYTDAETDKVRQTAINKVEFCVPFRDPVLNFLGGPSKQQDNRPPVPPAAVK